MASGYNQNRSFVGVYDNFEQVPTFVPQAPTTWCDNYGYTSYEGQPGMQQYVTAVPYQPNIPANFQGGGTFPTYGQDFSIPYGQQPGIVVTEAFVPPATPQFLSPQPVMVPPNIETFQQPISTQSVASVNQTTTNQSNGGDTKPSTEVKQSQKLERQDSKEKRHTGSGYSKEKSEDGRYNRKDGYRNQGRGGHYVGRGRGGRGYGRGGSDRGGHYQGQYDNRSYGRGRGGHREERSWNSRGGGRSRERENVLASTKAFFQKNPEANYTRRRNAPEARKQTEEQSVTNDNVETVARKNGQPTGKEQRIQIKVLQAKSENKTLEGSENFRERLEEQLRQGVYECMVCYERVRGRDSVWSCTTCHVVFHLRCISKWVRSSKEESKWRCPACQKVYESHPHVYYCFCGKEQNPEWNRHDTPHTCGALCQKTKNCAHPCTLLCHPGPCAACVVQVKSYCGCGKESKLLRCDKSAPFTCGSECGKTLNCGEHQCDQVCHSDPCKPCSQTIHQECYCGKEEKDVPCEPRNIHITEFSCSKICEKNLPCENHQCSKICHPGSCGDCSLSPELVTTCPCGQTSLSKLLEGQPARKSCLDPIPTCSRICSKKLQCGPTGIYHSCKSECHEGPCPPCPLTTDVKCRCGFMDKPIPCVDLKDKADDQRCNKRCNKRRSCGQHKCGSLCCIDVEHICELICGQSLKCGKHKCTERCHTGNCPPCLMAGFEELTCYCGNEVLYPPIPCGTLPPVCFRKCVRSHPCSHVQNHHCNDGTNSENPCPPCTQLVMKPCYGGHEVRNSVPCFQPGISCGRPCGKQLPCKRHTCQELCHEGPCQRKKKTCKQPCTKLREDCGHICGAACHQGDCPEVSCKEKIKVSCECGNLSASRLCGENQREYQQMTTALLAAKIADVQAGQSVDISQLTAPKQHSKLKSLQCNAECAQVQRNKRMALALQLQNPDLSSKLGPPPYSEFMLNYAKKNSHVAIMVHDKLTELVQLAKSSKQRGRSFAFPPGNRDQRQYIHEACTHFGCESESYDEEPKRNVVATAHKDKSWLPSVSIMAVAQKDAGPRKMAAPSMPIRASSEGVDGSKKLTTLGSNSKPASKPPGYIDYFDMS